MKRLVIISILLILACWLCAVLLHGAVPTFESFSTNQFQTNGNRVFYRAVHTNDNGIVYPALDNTLNLVTNLNSYGTFSLPSKVTLLTLGTNELDMSVESSWLLNSPTNDAAQVILSLSAGAYQGQFAYINSQNGGNGFTLPDMSEQYDVPGAYVDVNGDWIGTTNRGIILRYVAPDWVEQDRFDPAQSGGGTILGSGTSPYFSYWTGPTTLGTGPLKRVDANTLVFDVATTDVAELKFTNGLGYTLRLFLDTNNVVHLTGASADLNSTAGSARILSAASIYNFNAHIFTPGVSNTFLLGTELVPWKEVHVGTNSIYLGTNAYSDDGSSFLRNGIPLGGGAGTTINPTDGYIPYRLNSTTFSNSQWVVVNPKTLGFTSTNYFLTYTNFNLGIGGNALASLTSGSGNVAIGANSMQNASGGSANVAIGQTTLTSVSGASNVAIGPAAGGVSSGSQNVLVGGNSGLTLNAGNNAVMVGFQAGANSTVGENTFVGASAGQTNTTGNYNTYIGIAANGLTATDTNSIVIGANVVGQGSNKAVLGTSGTSLIVGDPGSGYGAWQFGKVITGVTVGLTITNYIEVKIDGVVKKIALVQ